MKPYLLRTEVGGETYYTVVEAPHEKGAWVCWLIFWIAAETGKVATA